MQIWKDYLLKMFSSLQLIWPLVFGVRDVKIKHLANIFWFFQFFNAKFPVALTSNVAVICLLSPAPFIGTFLVPF